MGLLGPSALRQFQIASSLRPDLQGSLQRSRVNLLCHGGVCAFLRPKVFASKYQGPAGKLSFPLPALPLSPSSEAGFCFSCCPPPRLHTCAWEPGEGMLGTLPTMDIWPDQAAWSGTLDIHAVCPFPALQPSKDIYNDEAQQALKSEKLHRAFDLTSHPWEGANHALSGGMQPTQGSTCL